MYVCGICTYPNTKPNTKHRGVKLTSAFKHQSIDKAAFRRLVPCCQSNSIQQIYMPVIFLLVSIEDKKVKFMFKNSVTPATV